MYLLKAFEFNISGHALDKNHNNADFRYQTKFACMVRAHFCLLFYTIFVMRKKYFSKLFISS